MFYCRHISSNLFIISKPVRSLSKSDKNCQEEFPASDSVKCSKMNLDLCKKVNLATSGIEEKDKGPKLHGKKQYKTLNQKIHSTGRQKLSLCMPVIENEQLMSGDSVATKPSVAQTEDLPSSYSRQCSDTITKCNSMIVEQTECLKINHIDLSSSQVRRILNLKSCVHLCAVM